MLIGEAIQ